MFQVINIKANAESLKIKKEYIDLLKTEIDLRKTRHLGSLSSVPTEAFEESIKDIENKKIILSLQQEINAKSHLYNLLKEKLDRDLKEAQDKLELCNKEFPGLIEEAKILVQENKIPSFHRQRLQSLLSKIAMGFPDDVNKVKAWQMLLSDVDNAKYNKSNT